ncbi:LemA family protein [Candidatus Microgenomates bacterium]|nr:MAG: LemA family protein [Candidatus Microgenomates bacterium]
MSPTIILIAIVAILALYVWSIYNKLATGKVRIKEALSSIDVQLKRRVDLIPNLIETVKGYAKHEKEVFENVTKARSSLMSAQTPGEKAESNNMLAGALKNLFALAENYPDLKASQNFLNLQEELSDTENKIAYSRQFYNSNVRDYNTSLVTFPSGMVGNFFGFKEEEFFEAEPGEREPVKVKF